ncbi:hypothetical protein F5X96DRAFT_616344 [Biscogniauxia mediterranea]|nr:hypothetical protein F5X96DRAFT_616344 [Biscogniauxia mediterranea]
MGFFFFFFFSFWNTNTIICFITINHYEFSFVLCHFFFCEPPPLPPGYSASLCRISGSLCFSYSFFFFLGFSYCIYLNFFFQY